MDRNLIIKRTRRDTSKPDNKKHDATERTGHDLSLQAQRAKIKSLPELMGAFKMTCLKQIQFQIKVGRNFSKKILIHLHQLTKNYLKIIATLW